MRTLTVKKVGKMKIESKGNIFNFKLLSPELNTEHVSYFDRMESVKIKSFPILKLST